MSSPSAPWPGDSFLAATLELVRPCPATPEYIELCFETAEGGFHWCFPEPSQREQQPDGPIALAIGPYGVQAHQVRDGSLGLALETSSALPMIIAGADVYIARRLVAASR